MGWAHVQLQANPRLELFADGLWTEASAAVSGLNYDPGTLAPVLVGLDYRMMSSVFGEFSDLDVRRTDVGIGANQRLSDDFILQLRVGVSRYSDRQPYLFDSTGRYMSFVAGLNWVF